MRRACTYSFHLSIAAAAARVYQRFRARTTSRLRMPSWTASSRQLWKLPPRRLANANFQARSPCSWRCAWAVRITPSQLRRTARRYRRSSSCQSHASTVRRRMLSLSRRLSRPTATRSCFFSSVTAAQCPKPRQAAPLSQRATTLAHTQRWRCCSLARSIHAPQAEDSDRVRSLPAALPSSLRR